MQSHRLPHDRQSAAHCDLHCHVSADLASHAHAFLPQSTRPELPSSCWLQCFQASQSLLVCRYFIFADVCLIMQYIYFQTLQRRKERLSLLRARLRPEHPVYRHAVRHPATIGEVSCQLVLCQAFLVLCHWSARKTRRMHACCRSSAVPQWPMAQQNGSAQSVSTKPHGVAALCAAAQACCAGAGPCMTARRPHTSWACRVLACIGVLLLVRAHLPSQGWDPGRVLLPSRRHLLVDAAGELGSDSNKGRPNWVV